MQKSMTATAARKDFFRVLKNAGRPGVSVTITHEGEPTVIMMSFEEYEGWQETMEILSDSTLEKDIREGIEEVRSGKRSDSIDLDTFKKQLNL